MPNRGSRSHSSGGRVSRRRVLATTGGTVAAVTAGCVGNGGDDGPDSVKFGAMFPQSGVFGYTGDQVKPAIQYTFDKHNDSNEILPDTKLEFVTADTKGDPEQAVTVAQELRGQEDVDHFLGPIFSSTANSVRNWIRNKDAVMTIFGSGPAFITNDENCTRKLFQPAPNLINATRAAAEHGVNNLGENVYVVFMDYAFGRAVLSALEATVPELGGSVVGTAGKPPGSEDYTGVINDIKDSDADWLFMGMAGSGAVPFFSQAAQAELDLPMHFNVTPDQTGQLTPDQFDKLGQLHSVVLYSSKWDRGPNQSFVTEYRDRTGQAPPVAASNGFKAPSILFRMINNAGGPGASVDDIIAAGRDLTYSSIAGELSIRRCNHAGLHDISEIEVTGVSDGAPEIELGKRYDITNYVEPCDEIDCTHSS